MIVRSPRTLPATPVLPTQWRLLQSPAMDGAWNMACDLWLMSAAGTSGRATLRVYGWSRPTISFGRHERVADVYEQTLFADTLAASGCDAVRRPTGGRALLHDREVTYSVTMAIADATPWRAAYDAVNAMLLDALRRLGIDACIAGARRADASAAMHDRAVCFSGVAPGEIAVADAKLVASAVWRERGAYLQHGSILIHDDQPRLAALLDASTRQSAAGQPLARITPAATLSAHLSPVPTNGVVAGALAAAAIEASCRHTGTPGEVVTWSIPPDDDAIAALRHQLLQPSWLWRC